LIKWFVFFVVRFNTIIRSLSGMERRPLDSCGK